MVSSEIRDLLSVTARPDIISLAGGLPNTQVMSAEMMSELAARVFAEDGPGALQYGPTDGFAPLKHVICSIMEEEGLRAYPEEVIITHGSQQALEMLSKIFINPGDTIIVEAPSYVGRAEQLHELPARVHHHRPGRGRHAAGPPGFRAGRPAARRPAGQVPLHRAQLPEPGRDHPEHGPAGGPAGAGAPARPGDHRGQPLRPAALRGGDAAAPEDARPGAGDLPGDAVQDLLGRPARRLGVRRRAGGGEGAAGQAVGRPVHRHPGPAHRPHLLHHPGLARRYFTTCKYLPGPAGRPVRGDGGALPGRGLLDPPRGRLLRLGPRPTLHQHQGHAGQGHRQQGRLRARDRVLPRRPRAPTRCASISPIPRRRRSTRESSAWPR